MHKPMEILSLVMTRTDSVSGVRQTTGPRVDGTSAKFERMFEKELTKHESRTLSKRPNPDDGGIITRPVELPKKDEITDKTGQELAAGVMGDQQSEVVFILEGDRESATTGAHARDAVVLPEINQDKANEAKPEPQPTEAKFTLEAEEVTDAITDQAEKHAAAGTADATAGTANADATITKPAPGAETSANDNSNAAVDVTARMPETRMQDRQDNAETSSKFSDNGNPSPLENGNDKSKVTGQKEKTFSEAADAVRNAAQDKPEPAVIEITPPLSEGIKPEQFRAAQQMTQAALSAPVKPENLFQEMISRVEMMQDDTKSAMTIKLNPEHLGNVALEVAVDAAGLHVKISAEDSSVRGMINAQLTALIESLENKGIEVAEVEVVYTGVNNGLFREPGEGQQQPEGHRQAKGREMNPEDTIAFYTTLPDLFDFYLDTGVSSVEYSA